MFFFVYDTPALARRFERRVERISQAANDLELPHDASRVGPLGSIDHVLERAFGNVAFDTVVIVGDESSFVHALQSFAALSIERSSKLTLGYVPITSGWLSQLLGMPVGEDAMKHISRKRSVHTSLGRVNDYVFLRSATLSAAHGGDANVGAKLRKLLPVKRSKSVSMKANVNGFSLAMDASAVTVSHVPAQGFNIEVRGPRSGNRALREKDLTRLAHHKMNIVAQDALWAQVDGLAFRQHRFRFQLWRNAVQLIVGPDRTMDRTESLSIPH